MVVKRECDLPMARSKNLLPCDRECKECMACIETTDTGERRHCTHLRDREIGPRIPPQNNKVRHEFEPARDCRKDAKTGKLGRRPVQEDNAGKVISGGDYEKRYNMRNS